MEPYYHKKPGYREIGAWGWDDHRLWSKIDTKPDRKGCLNWNGSMSPTGALMGAWKNGIQQMTQARRLVWMSNNNKDVSEYQVTLSCSNQRCCNEEHFVLLQNNRNRKKA